MGRLPAGCTRPKATQRPSPARTTSPAGPTPRIAPAGPSPSGQGTTRASNSLSRTPPAVPDAPGQGVMARVLRTIASASSSHRSTPSDGTIRGARVTPSSAWGTGLGRSGNRRSRASTRSAPSRARWAPRSPAVSSGPISTAATSRSGPVSSPSSICMIDTPVRRSPARIARWIGAAPRQRGSREKWTLMQPRRGAARTSGGRIRPYAATMATSTPRSRSRAASAPSRRRVGWRTGTPRASAATLTAGGVVLRPRPALRSGWVTTATGSLARATASRIGTTRAGLPMKTVRGLMTSRVGRGRPA